MMKRLLSILLLLISSTALAESGAYRVELIVFRNLETIVEAAGIETGVMQELRSFSHYPDLQQETQPITADSTEEQAIEVSVGPAGFIRSDLPDDFQVITNKSTTMDDAWRRLRSSKVYQPLVYGAWEQNRTDYYPPIRIHDQDIIDTQLRPPTAIMVADLAAEDPLAAYRSTFYRLDGSIQLRRSRFLHLFLDMELREKRTDRILQADLTAPGQTQASAVIVPGSDPGSDPDNRVFRLKQNRQIRTGQLQYFDTPYFGVLVFVSAISAE